MARILVLLKYGKHYVADEVVEKPVEWDRFISFELATGGIVRVPIDNVSAVEHYDDRDIETFRRRLHEVEEGSG